MVNDTVDISVLLHNVLTQQTFWFGSSVERDISGGSKMCLWHHLGIPKRRPFRLLLAHQYFRRPRRQHVGGRPPFEERSRAEARRLGYS